MSAPGYVFTCFTAFLKSVSYQDEVYLISIHISRALPGVCSPGALLEKCICDERVFHAELLKTLTPLILIT